MIKALSHQHGYDLFIRNSYGYLLHIWNRNWQEQLQDYKVIEEEVYSNPAVVYLNPNLHIFYIDKQAQLNHIQIHVINTFQIQKRTIAFEIDCTEDPICFMTESDRLFLRVIQKGEPCYLSNIFRNSSNCGEKERQGIKERQLLLEISNCWQKTKEVAFFQEIQQLSKVYRSGKQINTISKCKDISCNLIESAFYFLRQQKQVYFQESFLSFLTKTQKISQDLDFFDGLPQRLRNNLMIIDYSKQQITICYKNHKNQLFQSTVQAQVPPKSRVTLLSNKNTHYLVYLDQNEQVVRFPLIKNQQGKLIAGKSTSRPYLIWQMIKDKCFPLGQQGYHADCFYYKEKDLVIKKFRKAAKAFKSNRQVHSLKKIQQVEPNLFHHDVICKNILTGFSMTFYPGQNWFKLTADPENILKKSPVARVQLAIKLFNFMRKLQSIGFCHGDLHLQNVIIEIQNNNDLLSPKIDMKVIDFGNGFEMFEGETVSEGLTGFSAIVPPQAEFSHKKNYNPWGLNAYQLGRNLLQILLLNSKKNLCLLDYTPLKQLQLLRQSSEYPSDLYFILKELVHYSIERRNKALFQDISYLQQQARRIFASKAQVQ